MDDLGVADELERHESDRLHEVVVGDRVLVAVDATRAIRRTGSNIARAGATSSGRERSNVAPRTEARGACQQVYGEGDAGRRLAGEDDVVPLFRVVAGELQPDRPGPTDDDDRAGTAHRRSSSARWSRCCSSKRSQSRNPAIGMAGRRLRCLGLEPSEPARSRVVEAVDRPHAGERHVARTERVVLAVDLALDLAGEEDVRLLERVDRAPGPLRRPRSRR